MKYYPRKIIAGPWRSMWWFCSLYISSSNAGHIRLNADVRSLARSVVFLFSLSNTCAFWLPSMDLLTSSTPAGARLQETICWWGVSRATFQLAHFYCLDKLCCLEQSDNYKPILLNHIYYYIDELNMELNPLSKKGPFLDKTILWPSLP